VILSILDIKKIRKNYLIYGIVLVLFALIYESFSHGVYSNYMIFAFLIPLIYGFGGSFLLRDGASKFGNMFYNFGIITISVGSVFKGILDIYGTTNDLLYVYVIVGILFIIIGTIIYLYERKK